MRRKAWGLLLAALVLGLQGAVLSLWAAEAQAAARTVFRQAEKLADDGNYAEAYEVYKQLLLAPDTVTPYRERSMAQASDCLRRLNRNSETDALREKALAGRSTDWRLLEAVARDLMADEHYGFKVGGEIQRGPHRGGGDTFGCMERDRVKALRWLDQAAKLVAKDSDASPADASRLYRLFADVLIAQRDGNMAWRLQVLTDLETLPPLQEGRWGYGQPTQGAPVDRNGDVVLYGVPEKLSTARSDGERWRWALHQAATVNPDVAPQSDWLFACFLHEQFGVQTMASFARFLYRPADTSSTDRQNRLSLSSLDEDETLARLATGIRRFTLPPEQNFIAYFKALSASRDEGISNQALNKLAEIFENRRQYERAAAIWREGIQRFGDSMHWKQKRLDQIVGNWGQFEPGQMQPDGADPILEYRFRNGDEVALTARRIKVAQLLQDVQQYIESSPQKPDWLQLQIDNIGYRLVVEHQNRYAGAIAAKWREVLEPAPNHFDRRVQIAAPIIAPGAYLVTGKMKNGNTSHVILWVNNTVLIKKQLANQTLIFAADAQSGEPIQGLNIESFGYRRNVRRQPSGKAQLEWNTSRFAAFSNRDGMALAGPDELGAAYQWLFIATSRDATDDAAAGPARFACLGFSRVWYPEGREQREDRTKAFVMTDRPVYRPGQPVYIKTWLQEVGYESALMGASSEHSGSGASFANRSVTIAIQDPQGTTVSTAAYTTDAFGGVGFDWTPPPDARLGYYYISVGRYGSGSFRLEEYKKPEFEVTVDAPTEPVTLGERLTFTIKGRYYFGAPVTHGTVHYKVTRRSSNELWYPEGRWDWLYGKGYAWVADDWTWYPGWSRWGYPRPRSLWISVPAPRPDIVAEGEGQLDANGMLTVQIDTAADQALYGDLDQRYELTAEITDASRRTIVGTGSAGAAHAPFKVCLWSDLAFYHVGDTIHIDGSTRTMDGQPVPGQASIRLLRVRYNAGLPVETAVQTWARQTDQDGRFSLQMEADAPGQFRVSCMVTDRQGNTIEGAQMITVRGEGHGDFLFDTLQLSVERSLYAPGDRARLLIGTEASDQAVLLFERPKDGVYSMPRLLRTQQHTAERELLITAADRPNIFVEAMTVHKGKIRNVVRELRVPPDERMLTVDITPSADKFKPGAPAQISLQVHDSAGQPVQGPCVISVYDKALDAIAGKNSIPDIRSFFWKWRRHHTVRQESNMNRTFRNLIRPKTDPMKPIGVFGTTLVDDSETDDEGTFSLGNAMRGTKGGPLMLQAMAAPTEVADIKSGAFRGSAPLVQPTIRKAFADTAYWNGALMTDSNGTAQVAFDMPENLTAWRIRIWALSTGARVGEASMEVTTRKDLLLRLQAPRFFVEKDEVVLSANIHNYLPRSKQVQAVLELEGASLNAIAGQPMQQRVVVDAGGETRVDWRVRAIHEGEAVVRMSALTDKESDAMEMRFPVYVHGLLKTDTFSRMIRPDEQSCRIDFTVPTDRRPEASRLEVRTSPSLAASLVDALPYLAHYPYGCTEQTLNRFLPTLVVRQTLRTLGIDLKTLQKERALDREQRPSVGGEEADNPLFSSDEVDRMVREGIKRLVAMQVSDGGWGWFSGWGARSTPHTTAVVVQGLQRANCLGAAVPSSVLERGRNWLRDFQVTQRRQLDNAAKRIDPWKGHADDRDALVFAVLTEAGQSDNAMCDYLYRDRNHLSVYSKALLGLAMDQLGHKQERDMLRRNIEQYEVQDTENQTTYLELGNSGYWWYWYGSDTEAHAAYLRLLNAVDPKSARTAGVAKYLLNNRRYGVRWDATRDTAYCIEALADYLLASGERAVKVTVALSLDQQVVQRKTITPETLFHRNDPFVLRGKAITAGEHALVAVKSGDGPLYVNAALTLFTLEDMIRAAGLELKIERKLYRLHRQPIDAQAPGAHGQVVGQKQKSFFREPISQATPLKSGDLVEVDLTVTSKNDYEYIVIEDRKAAGMEPVAVRSGYTDHGVSAYVEYRDERVLFFLQSLSRGQQTLSYRLRAEIPGVFSALPAKAFGMYAPELTANSNEVKIRIQD